MFVFQRMPCAKCEVISGNAEEKGQGRGWCVSVWLYMFVQCYLCVRWGSAIYYHSVSSLEDEMFGAEVVLVGQSHYGNELFVTAGFKSQFCTGDVTDLSTQMSDQKRLYVSHGKTDGANRSLEPTAGTWRWWRVKNKVERAVWMFFCFCFFCSFKANPLVVCE